MASRLSILFSVLIAFGVSSLAAPAAHAQGKGEKEQMKAAQKHFKRATAHRELEEYGKAAEEYLAAYDLFPDPEFFFLAGEVYQLDGEKRLALEHFKKYVADDPDGRAVGEAKKFIKLLEKDIEREDADKQPPPADDDDDDDGDDDDDDDGFDDDDDDDGAAGGGSSPGKGKKIGGLVMLGLGGVALGLGGYFGSQAASISDEISDISGTWTEDDTARFEEGEAAERTMFIMYGIGAAAVVAGGVLYYLGATAKASDAERGDVSFAPAVTGTSVGFAASGWF
jgi:tetratricopeptide (TPR) repeat protein